MSDEQETLEEGMAQGAAELGRVNIAVLGNTGVGKSTLINAVFGDTFSDDRRPATGVGGPVTLDVEYFTNLSGTLGIYDFPGIETGQHVKELSQFFARNVKANLKGKAGDPITMIWYCVNAGSRRFDKGQEDFLRAVARLDIPVLLIVTQVEIDPAEGTIDVDATELARHIEALELPLEEPPLLVCAKPSSRSREHGLPELLDATFRCAPEGLRAAVTAAQNLDYERKALEARKYIGAAAAAAGSAGAIPLPGSDAAVIVPAQALMMGKVAAVYGLPLSQSTAVSVSVTAAATQVGRLAVGTALKFIPIAGSVINATVAAGVTFAIGEAWRVVCERIARGELSLDLLSSTSELGKVFLDQFKAQMSNHGVASAAS